MALIDDALKYLQITWDDPTLKAKLQGAMNRGQALIDDYAGSPQDYETAGTPQALLFDYMRYVRSDAAEVFEHNFQRDLLRLRMLNMANEALSEEELDDL